MPTDDRSMLELLKLELQVFVSLLMWVLKFEHGSSGRAVSALNFFAIYSATTEIFQGRVAYKEKSKPLRLSFETRGNLTR